MRLCDNCSRRHWRAKINKSTGKQIKHMNGNLVYVCIHCGHVQEEESPVYPVENKIRANILYIDIETSKSLYYNYGRKVPTGYLRSADRVKEWFMISWAASYVGCDNVYSQIVTPTQAREWDDSDIVLRLNEIMQSAEIIAGHNVDGFDLKKINTRFKKHNLPPITGKRTIDTLKIARSKYSLESNKLDYISKWLGVNGKDEITDDDWRRVFTGHKETLDKIIKYNRGDVINGKKVLIEMLPIANKSQSWGAIKGTIENLEKLKK